MKKTIRIAVVALMLVMVLALPALANPAPTLDVNATLSTAFVAAADSILGSIGIILPIALPILGISIAIGFAIKFFRKITSKAG
jgi:hypothetical protein